jgi:hypothetical protein
VNTFWFDSLLSDPTSRTWISPLPAGPVTSLANRFSSAPRKEDVFASLSKLYEQSVDQPGKKSGSMFSFNPEQQSIIIFSDQHKGIRNGADDFRTAEANYLAALDYYDRHQFYYVNLGDCEELWENRVSGVIKANIKCFEKEKRINPDLSFFEKSFDFGPFDPSTSSGLRVYRLVKNYTSRQLS